MSDNKIKLAIIYNGLTKNIKVSIYKTFEEIKEKIYKLFYINDNTDIYMIYNNKNLENELNTKIGIYLKELSFAKIVVKDKKSLKDNNMKKNKKLIKNNSEEEVKISNKNYLHAYDSISIDNNNSEEYNNEVKDVIKNLKVRLNITFNDISKSIDEFSHKTWQEIKEKIYKIFYIDKKNEITLICNNKNIDDILNTKIIELLQDKIIGKIEVKEKKHFVKSKKKINKRANEEISKINLDEFNKKENKNNISYPVLNDIEKLTSNTIKLIIIYNGLSKIIDESRNITWSNLKKRIINLFYITSKNVNLYCCNKNMQSFMNDKINTLLSGKNNVKISVISDVINDKKLKKNYSKNIYKNDKNDKNDFNNKKFILFNDLIKSQDESLQENKNYQEEQQNEEEDNVNIYDLGLKANGRKKLPPIQISTDNSNKKNSNQYIDEIVKTENTRRTKDLEEMYNNEFNDLIYNCTDCLKNKFIYFCRDCELFLCENCYNKNSHDKHNTIKIDESDILKNVEQYKEDIKNQIAYSTNFYDNIEITKEGGIDVDLWNTKFIDGIENLNNKAQELKEEYKDLDDNSKNIENKNFDIQKQEIKNMQISNKKDPFLIFQELNNKEKEIKKIVDMTLCNTEKSSKMKEIEYMFNDIENEINQFIFNFEINYNK